MKNIITIQHTQAVHHTNRMVGSWTDWELTELGKEHAEINFGNFGPAGGVSFFNITENGERVIHKLNDLSYIEGAAK